jgi:hypothetical protein
MGLDFFIFLFFLPDVIITIYLIGREVLLDGHFSPFFHPPFFYFNFHFLVVTFHIILFFFLLDVFLFYSLLYFLVLHFFISLYFTNFILFLYHFFCRNNCGFVQCFWENVFGFVGCEILCLLELLRMLSYLALSVYSSSAGPV